MIFKSFMRTLLNFVFICGLCIAVTGKTTAHEVIPNIADIRIDGKTITVDLRLNVEAYLAEINLAELSNTDEAEESGTYKNLRALASDELTARFEKNWADFTQLIAVKTVSLKGLDGFEFKSLRVNDDPNLDLPRLSNLSFNIVSSDLIRDASIRFDETLGTTILRQNGIENGLTQYLAAGQESDVMSADIGEEISAPSRFLEYIPIGFDHVVPEGLDHILFVLGLFLLSLKTSTLLWQVSAFTLAHTVTLIAGALGVVSVPASIVEPLIAASIVFVAVENIFFAQLNPWRTVIVFGFGLLHGLGFASVLSEFGLPEGQYIPALIGFNVGVEFGQLSVIAIAYLLLALPFGRSAYYRARVTIPASCIIALIGFWWVLERTLLA